MRDDMSKVVTERPRVGHSRPSLKTALRLSKDQFDADDHGSNRHPVSRRRQHGWDAKEFTDVLGPLRKFLHSQLGRPWDKVYSDLSKSLDRRSLTGIHIWNHVKWEVVQNVILHDGVWVHSEARFGTHAKVRGFYVNPAGILSYQAYKNPDYRKKVDPNVKKINETVELRRINGVWFHVVIEKKVRVERYPQISLKTGVTTYKTYTVETLIEKKRQLGKKELRDLGLKKAS